MLSTAGPWVIITPDKSLPLERVRTLRDAQYAICRDCGHAVSQHERPWKLSTTRWLHEHGMGHRMDYYRMAA